MMAQDLISVIGKTPLVKLRLDNAFVGDVYAKLELMNPFGMKDRVAKQIILNAKATGVLTEGAPIIESSSGTMALGVALVGTCLGHDVHIITDPRIDPLTLSKLYSMGCFVHIVEEMNQNGWQGARLEKLYQLLEEYPNAFWPRQYENPDNPLAYEDLAKEIIDDIGNVDILIGAVGSGGSLCGTAAALKKENPKLHVVAVDCVGSVLFGQKDQPYRLQGGLGNSLIPPNLNHSLIDEIHWLNDGEAFAATSELSLKEKIFAGNSSGSVYIVSRWYSQNVDKTTKIVCIFPDRGDRYFNTIYNNQYLTENGLSPSLLPSCPMSVDLKSNVKAWSFASLKGVKVFEEDYLVY